MQNLNKITHLFLSKMGNLQDKKIICGYSGGADSAALLHNLIEKQTHFGYSLEAVFFSHGDSPIAVDEDKMFDLCSKFCKGYNIPFKAIDLNLEKLQRQGWESSGRKARQSFYKDEDCDYVFLGHHKDDQNETTMIQFMRGGGKGASAMKSIEGIYCRPFLNVHKKDIYEYLRSKNISWFEDPTNTNTDFTRNFWRNVGLPTIEQHYPKFTQMLDNYRQKNRELHDLAYELAVTDGLEELKNGKSVSVENFSTTRLKNLLVHYFNAKGKSAEDAFFDQQVAHYDANKKLNLNHKGVELSIYKGMFSPYQLEQTLIPAHSLRKKM